MTTENKENLDPNTPENNGNEGEKKIEITPEMQALIDARAEELLKPMKANVDKAYAAKAAAEAKAAALEAEKRQAEIARLTEEGKHREAFELQLKEEKALREQAERRNVELTRDIELRNALAGYDFRKGTAMEMAFRELVSTLIQDANGKWVHKTGVTIADAVKSFVGNEDNAFLLNQKVSTGGGSPPPKGGTPPSSGRKKSVFDMSQDEVLALAAEGKLRNRK